MNHLPRDVVLDDGQRLFAGRVGRVVYVLSTWCVVYMIVYTIVYTIVFTIKLYTSSYLHNLPTIFLQSSYTIVTQSLYNDEA